MEKKKTKLLNVVLIIIFVVALFFLVSGLVYKVKAADGTDSIVYELSGSQYRRIIALLTVIAFSSISNCVIALTRKG